MGNLAAIATEGPQRVAGELELTVVMPCLNEAETVAICVTKAMRWLHAAGVDGEVVVADNGSTDNSVELAEAAGARVVIVRRKGYGNALMSGIRAARGTYVIMADADDSYDLENLGPFLAGLRGGKDLVMGNRFKGGIEPGAMPWLHRWIGNPVLSGIGRLFFRTPVRDFHCGMRGFRKDAILGLGLRSGGMEFASEMVVKATLAKLAIDEVPTTLRPDGRSRAPHLRSFRDGWRHLRFLLLFCPRWMFVYPGIFVLAFGAVGTTALTFGYVGHLDIAALLYAAALMIIGYQALWFGLLMQNYAETRGILPMRAHPNRFQRRLTLERGLVLGAGMIVFGLIVALLSFIRWRQADYGALNPGTNVRTIVPAILGLVMGSQTILGSFSIGVLSIRTADEQPVQRAPLETPAPRAPEGMRVLTAAHYWLPHVGGVEFEAREQSRRLVERGHDVTAISSRIGDDRVLSFDDGFPVHKVAATNWLEERIRLPYPLFSPALFSVASRLARDAEVVFAHTHTFMSTIAAAYAARKHRKPFVLNQNNPYIEYKFPLNVVQRTADATIGRYTVGSADRLLAISDFTAQYVHRLMPGA